MTRGISAVDLFAGHGWGVALKRLGIREHGVELMPEARATREANGMHTWLHDVWDVLEATADSAIARGLARHELGYDPTDSALLIASPPCQTFSMAGSGAGRRALDEVVGLIHSRAFLDPAKLREFGEAHDPRTALVLTPLTYVARHVPTYVVFEQVPTVLPVWQAAAEVLREWGYSVWTGNLQAEQYGVPQTRKRAVLIARADGREAKPPTPTHSRYYPRDPKRLDEGVAPWVSMADALGWGRQARPSVTITGGGEAHNGHTSKHSGGPEVIAHLGREVAAPDWKMRSNYGTGGDASNRGERRDEFHDSPVPMPALGMRPSSTQRVTIEEAAILQSYPPGFTFAGNKGKQFLQVGNAVPPLLAEAILREVLDIA